MAYQSRQYNEIEFILIKDSKSIKVMSVEIIRLIKLNKCNLLDSRWQINQAVITLFDCCEYLVISGDTRD
jgi:hypothetical protein